MAKLIAAIVRHGDYQQLAQTPSAHQPFPLTELGQQQARSAAQKIQKLLAEEGWSLSPTLACSFQLRAWQTADLIRDSLQPDCSAQLSLVETNALAERGVGSLANLTTQQIESILSHDPRFATPPPGWKSDSHYCLPLPGAESLLQAGKRVANYLESTMTDLAQQVTQDTLQLFVGHGAAFRHGAYHLGLLAFDQLAQLSMYHAEPIFLEYCPSESVASDQRRGTWRKIGGDWKIRPQGSAYKD